MVKVIQNLQDYDPSKHERGASRVFFGFWTIVSVLFFKNPFFYFPKLKVIILRLFKAKIGKNVLIKTGVTVRYPWKLEVGDNCWIGEDVWIENLAKVTIGSNVCISQAAFICSGSHDYRKKTFDDNSKPIDIEDGVWIGARAVLGPGVRCELNSILSMNSVAIKNIKANSIYMGNPAKFLLKRGAKP